MANLLQASGETATGLLGKQNIPKNLGYPTAIIIVPSGTEIATKALANTEATWLNGINSADSVRYRMLPIDYDVEPVKEDDTYHTSSIGNVSFVQEGKTTTKHILKVSPFVLTQLRTLNGVDWEYYEFTSEGFIKATTSDGTLFEPFSIQNFRVEGEVPASGDTPALVTVSVTGGDPTEWNDRGAFVEPLRDGVGGNWNVRDLKDPKAIIPTVDTPTGAGFNLTLVGYDSIAHEGAVKEDIAIYDAAGDAVTVTSATEGLPGVYAIVATLASEAHTAGLLPVGSPTTQGYSTLTTDLAAFTVS